MTKRDIFLRIELLIDVFAFSLEKGGLNTGQRICLTQERAAWLEVLEWQEIEDFKPKYVVPKQLELKVQNIANKIKELDWVKPEYQPLF